MEKKAFTKGGLTDTTPPKRGPMSQGIAESVSKLIEYRYG